VATDRSYWSQLVGNGTAHRDFNDIQIHNVVTLAAHICITILEGIADAYKEQHPAGSAIVTQFQLRP
jgi:hypothetical protein